MLDPIHSRSRAPNTAIKTAAKGSSTIRKSTSIPVLPPLGGSVVQNGAEDDTRHVSKLETEVLKLEARGTALVQTEGNELEGVSLLEKALRARARFPALNTDAWQRAEQFVVVCNQLAVRVMQRVDDGYVEIADELMHAAERTLCNSGGDSFTGFHPLRQNLLGLTLSNTAALHVLNGQPLEVALTAVEKALAVEAPRPSTLSLFNLAALQVRLGRFDDAMQSATKVIALADHYLKLHVNLSPSNEEAFTCFQTDAASHAVLAHHLIVSVAMWCKLSHIAQHHAKLALRCAERFLGQHHALTSRALFRVQAAAAPQDPAAAGNNTVPPQIPLQMATFTAPVPPSQTLPFTLVSALPASVTEMKVDPSKLPPVFASTSSPTATRTRAVAPAASARQERQPAPPSTAPTRAAPQSSVTARHATTAVGPKAATAVDAKIAGVQVPHPPPATASKGGRTTNLARNQQPAVDDDASTLTLPSTTRNTPTIDGARDPAIEAWATPGRVAATVSTIAKLDYEMYVALQAEVAQIVVEQADRTTAGPTKASQSAPSVMPIQGPAKARFEAGSIHFSDADVAASFFAADRALEQLSVVKPDHTDEDEVLWDRAARKLQRWSRLIMAKMRLANRKAAIEHHFRRVGAVERIEIVMQNFLLRKRAKAEVTKRRRYRDMVAEFAWSVQSAARTYLSYVEYCKLVEAKLTTELAARRLARRRFVAATGIQACWRSHRARAQVWKWCVAARKIQRFFRLTRLYIVMRTIVFQRREDKRVEHKLRDRAALRIQVWWKHAVKMLRASRLRESAARAICEYLELKTEREAMAWRRFAGVDEDMMARILQRFFRRLTWCKREHTRQITVRRRKQAASKVQRAYRWCKASTVKDRRYAARVEARRIQKRKEDVREATIDIQRVARGMLARRLYARKLHQREVRIHATLALQRFAAMIRSVKIKRDARALLSWDRRRYEVAAARDYAATRIQALARGVRDRAFTHKYRHFMSVERHAYASRIQRLWRFYAARKVRHAQWTARNEQRRDLIRTELLDSSTRRIQHAFRTFIIRCQVRRRLAVPVSRQVRAALKIQRVIRYFLARQLVMRLLAAKRYAAQCTAGEEHLNVFAMIIQRQARRAFLNPRRLEERRSRQRETAARTLQKFFRQCANRRVTFAKKQRLVHELEAAYEVEERDFAAVRIQKIVRGRQVRNRRSARGYAVSRIARWFRGLRSRRIASELRAIRQAQLAREIADDRRDAASVIQRAWKRRMLRATASR